MFQSHERIAAVTAPARSIVIMSGYHDYRSKRKVDLHFIADELKKLGKVTFISLRYSYLTRYKEDPRHDLWKRANKFEMVDGVGCFLWRTPVHPFGLPTRVALAEKLLFSAFASHLNQEIRAALQTADTVLVESGLSIIYIPLIKRINPRLRIVYMASDSLDAIGQADAVKAALRANAGMINHARVPSPYLAADLPASVPSYYIPHGIDKAQFQTIGPSPFPSGSLNAVSVGSMLFDPAFFAIAAGLFPNVTFHVIGSGYKGFAPPNVRYYPEMPFAATLPYLKHASFAVAPYRKGVEPYLTHTSMKLMQYNYLGIAAVCPQAVAGSGLGRFGYEQDRPETIRAAITDALQTRRFTPQRRLDWAEVAWLTIGNEVDRKEWAYNPTQTGRDDFAVGSRVRAENIPV
jgi:2-beta-glucuronyltransferase